MEEVAQAQLGLIEGNKGLYLGPHLFGCVFDAVLMGNILYLFVHWLTIYRKRENKPTQVLAVYLILLSIGVTAYIMKQTMDRFVYAFGEYNLFTEVICGTKDKICVLDRALNIHFLDYLASLHYFRWYVLIDVLARIPVSVLFASRASYILDRSPTFTYIMFVVLGMSVATAAAYGTVQLARPSMASELLIFYHCLVVTADVIITSTLGFLLAKWLRTRRGSGRVWKRVERVFTETPLVPSIIAVIGLIMHIAKKDNPLEMTFIFTSKTYILSAFLLLTREFPFHKAMKGKHADGDDYFDYKISRRPTVATIVPIPSSNRDEEDRAHQWNQLPPLGHADADVDADADTHDDHPAAQHGHSWGMPSNRDHKITFASNSASASHTNEGGGMDNYPREASAPAPYNLNQARINYDDVDFGMDPLDAGRPAVVPGGHDHDHDNKHKGQSRSKNRMSMYHPNPNSDREIALSDPSASASAHGPRSASAPPLPMTVQSARVVAGGSGVSQAQEHARGYGQA